MELHETLRELAATSGPGVFDDADLLRGALDDYLDEGAASTGEINLLVDAVRLGSFRMMLSTIDSGAQPARAVETAGDVLARDRGTTDVAATRWACAVLGYAVGRVGDADVRRFERPTSQSRPSAPPPAPPTWGPPVQSPVQSSGQSPVQSPWQPPPTAPPHQPPYAPAGYPGSYHAAPPAKPKRTGLLVAIGAVALVVVAGVLTAVLLVSGDDDGGKDTADDQTSSTGEPTTDQTVEPTDEPTEVPTEVPAGAIEGNGYYFTPPERWTDVTDEVVARDDAGQTDVAVGWGNSFEVARANVIVETGFAGGETDPEVLRPTWERNMAGATGATPEDNGTTEIDGETAVGVLIARINENDVPIEQFGYLTIHDGDLYSVILSTQAGDKDAQAAFEELLATWTWTT
ncbi:hypothetical protein [Nocardioides sp. cx-173]|uniref:hypothetical protein n=1 Tax=Nocardioides sp. cx-173 TaxID=2898796 RepID=UPI001E46D110|nr:hypothetical protein [Nocardioides sp. cx-173]MCD4527048.1 hypothetical protein [Nocardioides sp. cx-173]UGB41020.1 hypothetical protein LQ940_16805 [Nocardioides sp. cx-173]